jgi:hypothetical protein
MSYDKGGRGNRGGRGRDKRDGFGGDDFGGGSSYGGGVAKEWRGGAMGSGSGVHELAEVSKLGAQLRDNRVAEATRRRRRRRGGHAETRWERLHVAEPRSR